jgi:hypothetical protein
MLLAIVTTQEPRLRPTSYSEKEVPSSHSTNGAHFWTMSSALQAALMKSISWPTIGMVLAKPERQSATVWATWGQQCAREITLERMSATLNDWPFSKAL